MTGVASTDNIQTGTPATFLSNVNITGVTTATGGVNVGTADGTTIFANGNITAGIVTATSFVGDGSGLQVLVHQKKILLFHLQVQPQFYHLRKQLIEQHLSK